MRCDLHVHTVHSGMCAIPVLRKFCRESYNDPQEVYEILKRRGMDLVTITDHDSIGAAESLRKYPDFFASEEVSCLAPSGSSVHVGVYDITERDHVELQRRREDLLSLIFYLQERRLLFSVNHLFSGLTGRLKESDFVLFEHYFPLLETRNGQMSAACNLSAAKLAARWEKPGVAGSDAHSHGGLGRTYTTVPGARGKTEFLENLRCGGAVHGESGSYFKLSRSVVEIAGGLFREREWALCLAPLLPLIPAVTAGVWLAASAFERRWAKRILTASTPDRGRGVELEVGEIDPHSSRGVLDKY